MKHATRVRLVAVGTFCFTVAVQSEATPIVLRSSKAVSVASIKGELVGGGTVTDQMSYTGPAWPITTPPSLGAGPLFGGDEEGEAVMLFAGVVNTIDAGYLGVETRAEANWYGGPPSLGTPTFDMQRSQITAFGMLQWVFKAPAGITASANNGAGLYGGEGIVVLTDLTTGADAFRTHTGNGEGNGWIDSDAQLEEGHVYKAKIMSRTTRWDDEWIPVDIAFLDATGRTPVTVPEPGTFTLLGSGLLALNLLRRRRRSLPIRSSARRED